MPRAAGLPPSDPSRVNLLAFTGYGFDANHLTSLQKLTDFRSGTTINGHYFNSIVEARQVDSLSDKSISSLIDNEKFNLTTASQTPDLNIFGEPRIVLTTQKNLAGNAPFLDILNAPNTDPGTKASINTTSYAAVVASISAILNRTDWPYKPGASFASKYAPSHPQQIAMNIIDYVRARESTLSSLQQIGADLDLSGTNSYSKIVASSVGSPSSNPNTLILGLTRGTFRVTEIGIKLQEASAGPPKTYTISLRLEFHLPLYAGLDQVDLKGFGLDVYFEPIYQNLSGPGSWLSPGGKVLSPYPDPPGNSQFISNDPIKISTSLVVKAGEYRVMEFPLKLGGTTTYTWDATSTYTRSSLVAMDFAVFVYSPSPNSLQLSGLGSDTFGQSNSIRVPVEPESNAGLMPSLTIGDPYIDAGKWKTTAGGLNGGSTWGSSASFPSAGAENTTLSGLGKPPTVTNPQQDTDASGNVTNTGIRFPSPKGTSASSTGQMLNPNGVVQSVAELGFIHTGNDITASSLPVPSRTLRLQPKNNANSLPDWALLDMFTVPAKSKDTAPWPSAFSLTSTDSARSIGGRINLNATIFPFTDSNSVVIKRTKHLEAALLGALNMPNSTTTLSSAQSASLAATILNFTPASANLGNTGNQYGFSYFLSRGELAEVDLAANGGEDSEELLRSTIDLFTTRSNIFHIYSIGQVIKQQSSGTIAVQAEKRLETLVTSGTNSATVTPFYSRNLKP